MKSEKLAVLIADGDRDYEAEMIERLQRQDQRVADADAGGSLCAYRPKHVRRGDSDIAGTRRVEPWRA